jgi:type IV pilus assembly protein PilE
MRKGFTLMEILIIMVIISILGTLAIPAYQRAMEMTFDNQVKANLKLIVSAEKTYYLDTNSYYTTVGSQPDAILGINNALALALDAGDNRKWDYYVSADNPGWECAQASRTNSPNGYFREWHLRFADDPQEPTSGGCPD